MKKLWIAYFTSFPIVFLLVYLKSGKIGLFEVYAIIITLLVGLIIVLLLDKFFKNKR